MKKIILLIAFFAVVYCQCQISVGPYDAKANGGALGNGTTDDKTFLQNLVNSAPAGSAIHIPSSTGYLVNSAITISKLLYISGDNTLIQTTSNIPIFEFLTGSEKSKVEGFRFAGNSTGTAQVGIYCNSGGFISITKNSFSSLGGAGVRTTYIENSNELGTNIVNNEFYNDAIGIDLQERGEYGKIVANTFIGCTKAIYAIGGNALIDANNIVYCTNGIEMVYGINTGKTIISNNHINHTTTYAVNIYSVTNGVTLDNNHIIFGTVRTATTNGVLWTGGLVNVASYIFDNNTAFRIEGVSFPNSLANTLTQTGPAPVMMNCYHLDGRNAAYVNSFYYEKNNYTVDGTFSIPKGYYIESITFENTTANAVTGGIRIGTTSGGTEVIVSQAVGANELVAVYDATILKSIFSFTASQTLYIQAVTAWNSANINLYFKLKQL